MSSRKPVISFTLCIKKTFVKSEKGLNSGALPSIEGVATMDIGFC